jgi:hypothetical protein
MKYSVIQEMEQKEGTGLGFRDVALCARGDDALLLAEALLAHQTERSVQVWAEVNGKRAFCLWSAITLDDYFCDRLAKARREWKAIERKWRADQKAANALSRERMALLARLIGDVRECNHSSEYAARDARYNMLLSDEVFRLAFCGPNCRLADAEVRAKELLVAEEVTA